MLVYDRVTQEYRSKKSTYDDAKSMSTNATLALDASLESQLTELQRVLEMRKTSTTRKTHETKVQKISIRNFKLTSFKDILMTISNDILQDIDREI